MESHILFFFFSLPEESRRKSIYNLIMWHIRKHRIIFHRVVEDASIKTRTVSLASVLQTKMIALLFSFQSLVIIV